MRGGAGGPAQEGLPCCLTAPKKVGCLCSVSAWFVRAPIPLETLSHRPRLPREMRTALGASERPGGLPCFPRLVWFCPMSPGSRRGTHVHACLMPTLRYPHPRAPSQLTDFPRCHIWGGGFLRAGAGRGEAAWTVDGGPMVRLRVRWSSQGLCGVSLAGPTLLQPGRTEALLHSLPWAHGHQAPLLCLLNGQHCGS